MTTIGAYHHTESHPGEAQAAQAVFQSVFARSATDAAFRAQLLTDPRAAMSQALDCDIPAELDVRFVENHAQATFVLPDLINPDAELSEDDLESVAGGAYWYLLKYAPDFIKGLRNGAAAAATIIENVK